MDITRAERMLLDIMSDHQFGRLENVPVHDGQPVLDQSVKVVRVARLGAEGRETPTLSVEQFELKKAACDLLDELVRLGEGMIVRLEFRHGLPFLLETVAAAIPEDTANAPESHESQM